MKNITKSAMVIGGLLIAGFYIVPLGINHRRNSFKEGSRNDFAIRRPDGARGWTQYNHAHYSGLKEDLVYKQTYNRIVFLTDGGAYGECDGLVDKLRTREGSRDWRMLLREEDYKEYKEEFDEADKLLADTKERFKGYFE